MSKTRRCRWCELRIGESRYFLDGQWTTVPAWHVWPSDVSFTDGICAQCFETEVSKLKAVAPGVAGEANGAGSLS